MPANVPDAKLRGRVRTEKAHGHAKGGANWRTYPTLAPKDARVQRASWWLGLDREAFAVARRVNTPPPDRQPVPLPADEE